MPDYGRGVPLLGPADPLPARPRRVLVAGPPGAGKTTLAAAIGTALGLPHVEIDGLYHGPGWQPRAEFEADVLRFSAEPAWVTEWQYTVVRPLLADRADLLVWLDLPRPVVMYRVTRRTLARRVRRTELWNGNVEPPLWTVLRDRDHLVRWTWRTYGRTGAHVRELLVRRPGRVVVRLRSAGEVARWRAGPLRARTPGG